MSKRTKCFVEPCRNHAHQGRFKGDVCMPCFLLAQDIETGNLWKRYHFEAGCVQFIVDNWRKILEKARNNGK